MKTTLRHAIATLAIAAFATPAFAHHGWSDYDTDKPMTLTGMIKSSEYENLHASITLDAAGRTWTVVLAPVSRMEARGAPKEAVAVDREVTVVAYPSRTHAGEARAERLMFKDASGAKSVELR